MADVKQIVNEVVAELLADHGIGQAEILDALGCPTWLTRKEAAEHMRVSERTIDRWADDDLLQEYKVGGLQSTRFKRADLDAMVKPVEPGVPATSMPCGCSSE